MGSTSSSNLARDQEAAKLEYEQKIREDDQREANNLARETQIIITNVINRMKFINNPQSEQIRSIIKAQIDDQIEQIIANYKPGFYCENRPYEGSWFFHKHGICVHLTHPGDKWEWSDHHGQLCDVINDKFRDESYYYNNDEIIIPEYLYHGDKFRSQCRGITYDRAIEKTTHRVVESVSNKFDKTKKCVIQETKYKHVLSCPCGCRDKITYTDDKYDTDALTKFIAELDALKEERDRAFS